MVNSNLHYFFLVASENSFFYLAQHSLHQRSAWILKNPALD